MPWREQSVTDQRREFVALAMAPGANMRELCRRFGISRSNGYKWLQRYLSGGHAGLSDRSRRPLRSPGRTPASVETEVLRIRSNSNNAWGGRKIAKVMEKAGHVEVPAASTITEILRRAGKLDEHKERHPGPHQRFERASPNELWQMDFKGHFPMVQGRCHPLTVLDDHSRFSLTVSACGNEQERTARARLVPVFRLYGLPFSMLMDNGPPWGDPRGQAHTGFTVWLMQIGIQVIHGRPLHPQTQGKDERFHRTLKAELLNGRAFRNLLECQHAFDRWRHIYNHERPHEALGLVTPAERYCASTRAFPERLSPIEYGPGDTIRKVDINGRIVVEGRRFFVGSAFRGHPLALRPTLEDGVFSIHFCAYQIGILDLRGPGPQQQQHSLQ